jgi:type II secretory pathway pseudopilin PulG
METPRNNRGISLVEVMVCLTMLAVIALALADGLVSSMSATSVVEERAAALRSAQEKLNHLVAFAARPSSGGCPLIAPQDGTTYPCLNMKPGGVITNFVFSAAPVTTNGVTQPAAQSAFFDVQYRKVDAAGNGNGNMIKLPALNGADPNPDNAATGELVMFTDETVVRNARGQYLLGRDLTGGAPSGTYPFGGPDGTPDGVGFDFTQINSDLDVDGLQATRDIRSTDATDNPNHCFASNRGRAPVGAVVRWRGADGREQRVEVWTIVDFCLFIDPLSPDPVSNAAVGQ